MSIIGYLLIALGSWIALLNWSNIVVSYRSKRFVSAIPLLGGLFLLCGMVIFPTTRPYWWVAIVADWGTLVVIISVPFLVIEFCRSE